MWLWLTLVVLVVDQWTKSLASAALILHRPVEVIPYLNFTLAHNRGAAFSFLADAGGWQKWFFIVLALAVSVLLVVWLARLASHHKWQAASLALILGGALGNVIDRYNYDHVVDFIDVYYVSEQCLPLFASIGQTCHWPAFNVADSAIAVGAVLLIIDSFFEHKRHKKAQETESP